LLSTQLDNYGLLQIENAENNIESKNSINTNISSITNRNNREHYISIAAWASLNHSLILQNLKGEEQKTAINSLLMQGFHDYYFAMNNFENTKYSKLTEELLCRETGLKIIFLLRPLKKVILIQIMIGKVG
jgi:hypothetical protein